MTDAGAPAGCIAWVAHGFEIVHRPFADWRFQTCRSDPRLAALTLECAPS